MQLKTVGESLGIAKTIDDTINSLSYLKGTYGESAIVANKLAQATKGCSTEALKMAISQSTVNAESIKTMLAQSGLEGEVLETTTAELAQVTSTNALSVAQDKATVSTSDLKNAMSGLGSKLKGVGSSALSFAKVHPVITAITAVVGLVVAVNTEIKKYQEEQEELIENAKTLQEEYRNLTKSLSDSINSLEGQEDEFNRLAQGVDEFGNNISLSADEYERYTSIVKEVLGYTPELISGYDAEGNAIANKNSLIERSIELMKEEQRQRLKEMTTDEKTGTAYDAAVASWDKTKGYEGAHTRENIVDILAEEPDRNNPYFNSYAIAEALGLKDEYKASGDNWSSFVRDNIEQVAEAIKAHKDDLRDVVDNKDRKLFSEDELKGLIDEVDTWQEQYADWQQSIEDAKHGMDDQFELYAQRADGYDDLTDAQKAFVNEYIKATGDIIDADGNLLSEDEILEKAKSYEKFVDKLASNPNFDNAREKINKLYSLDSDVSAGEYEKQVDTILGELQKEFDLTDDEIRDFKISLGFEFTSEGTTRTDELVQMVQDKLKDDFDDRALELSLDDLVIASKKLEVPEGVELSWEEFLELLNEAKNIANKTEVLKFEDLFNADSIDETKQKLLDLATSGELSAETIESTEEYKALLDQTAMSAQEFVDAIERFNIDNLNASYEKYNAVLEKVRNGQTMSSSEIAEYIHEHEELAGAVLEVNGAYSLEEDALEKIINKYIETSNIAISNQITQTKKTIEAIKERIKAYGIEENAINKYGVKIGDSIKTLTKIWEFSGGSEDAIAQYLYDNFGMSATSMTPQIIKMIESNAELNELLKEIDKSFENLQNNSSGSSSSTKTFDWLKTLISRIQTRISDLGKTVSATYLSWSQRNNDLTKEMSAINEEIIAQGKAYDFYMSEANKVAKKLNAKDKTLVGKVQKGDYSIKDYDSDTADLISEYETLYEKALSANSAVLDAQGDLASLAKQSVENVVSEYDDIISEIESRQNKIEAFIDQQETDGHIVSKSYYSSLIDMEKENITALEKELGRLKVAYDTAMSGNGIEMYSEDWYDMQSNIMDVEQALIEANTALIEYGNSIRDLDWEEFDRIQEKISQIYDETEFLIELMRNEDMFTDTGKITEYGQATMGLYAVNYQTYVKQAEEYASELAEIEKALANESNDQELINRKEELIELQRESILNAQNELDSIVSLREEGFNKLLDSLDEAIEKYNDLQDAEKSLYDYQNTIGDQVEEVERLEKIVNAYKNDDSESGKAKLQEYSLQLEDAKQDLEETQMDRNIQEREKLLTSISDDAKQFVAEYLDNEDLILQEALSQTNSNLSSIKETLDGEASEVGTAISTNLSSILNGEGGLVSIENTISDTLTDIKELIEGMGGSSDNAANKNINDVNTNGANTTTPTAPSTPSTGNTNTDNSASGSSDKDWGSFFIDKDNSAHESKLNYNTSIVD